MPSFQDTALVDKDRWSKSTVNTHPTQWHNMQSVSQVEGGGGVDGCG